MKKRRILALIPLLGLFLTGCDAKSVLSSAKHWISQNIYHPIKDLIDGKSGEEQKPAEEGGKEEGGGEETVVVTRVTISKSSLNLTTESEDVTLTASVVPAKASQEVSWSVAPEGVVTVNAGKVHVVAAGDAVVTATSVADTTKKATCTVKVTEPGPGPGPTPTGGDGSEANPYTVAEARAIAAELVVEQNKSTTYAESPVYVTGVAKGDAKESTKTAGTYQFYMAETVDDKDDLNFYWGTLADNVEAPQKGYTVVVHGTLAHYKNDSGNSTYELAGNETIEAPVVVSVAAPTLTGISFKSESYNVYAGAEKDLSGEINFAPVGATGEVTFAVSGNEKATITEAGVLTLAADAEGTATVTATCGDLHATCTINVQKGEVQSVDVTIVAGDGTAVDGGSAGALWSISKDDVTLEATGTLTATEMRIFKNKTFVVSSSKTITKIVMTCTAKGTTKQGPGCWGAGAPAGYTFEADGPTGTWEGSGSSISFTASDNQVRISSIVVTVQ